MFADVVHSFFMFAGMIIAAIVIVTAVPGGLSEIFATLQQAGKTAMTASIPGFAESDFFGKFKLFLVTDITVLVIVFHYSLQKMGNYCVDQAMVQRYLTARSLRTSREGFICNCGAYLFYITIMTLVGAALFSVASHFSFPDTLRNDHVFPYFIANLMPVGIAGLMVAAIYGASMSSLDSGVNSCVTAILNDFYTRLFKKRYNLDDTSDSEAEKRAKLRIARASTLVLGVIITFFACFVGQLGDIFTVSMKLVNMFAGPLFGIFLLGMFTRRATGTAALIGGFLGFVVGSLSAFSQQLSFASFKIGFLWPPVLAFSTTCIVGYALSFVLGRKNENASQWTWKGVMSS
jgi:Na+/proline symporter